MAQAFPIVAGGGLSPTDFELHDGESQQFDDVPEGDGYSIVETVPDGWNVSYEVSNGSPHTNITVAAGEAVIVIVTNRPVCPGDLLSPRIDGIAAPYPPSNCEGGSGTLGPPRIGV